MMAIAQATPDIRADNNHYRITRWTLPSRATTEPYPHGFRATILPSTPGQLLCNSSGQEQHIDLVAGQPIEIVSRSRELVNTTEHEVAFTMIEFKY